MPNLIDSLIIELGLDPKGFNQNQKDSIQKLRELEKEATTVGKNIDESFGAKLAASFLALSKPLNNLSRLLSHVGQTGEHSARRMSQGFEKLTVAGLNAYAAFKLFEGLSDIGKNIFNQAIKDTGRSTATIQTAGILGMSTRTMQEIAAGAYIQENVDPTETLGFLTKLREDISARMTNPEAYSALIRKLAILHIHPHGRNGQELYQSIIDQLHSHLITPQQRRQAINLLGISPALAAAFGNNSLSQLEQIGLNGAIPKETLLKLKTLGQSWRSFTEELNKIIAEFTGDLSVYIKPILDRLTSFLKQIDDDPKLRDLVGTGAVAGFATTLFAASKLIKLLAKAAAGLVFPTSAEVDAAVATTSAVAGFWSKLAKLTGLGYLFYYDFLRKPTEKEYQEHMHDPSRFLDPWYWLGLGGYENPAAKGSWWSRNMPSWLGGGGGGGKGGSIIGSMSGRPSTKDIFDYVYFKTGNKNVAAAFAAQASVESTNNPAAYNPNDNGGESGGLFQWHLGRFSAMTASVPDWRTNWKGQVDYALNEMRKNPGLRPGDVSSPYAAGVGLTRHFERPANLYAQSRMRGELAVDIANKYGDDAVVPPHDTAARILKLYDPKVLAAARARGQVDPNTGIPNFPPGTMKVNSRGELYSAHLDHLTASEKEHLARIDKLPGFGLTKAEVDQAHKASLAYAAAHHVPLGNHSHDSHDVSVGKVNVNVHTNSNDPHKIGSIVGTSIRRAMVVDQVNTGLN